MVDRKGGGGRRVDPTTPLQMGGGGGGIWGPPTTLRFSNLPIEAWGPAGQVNGPNNQPAVFVSWPTPVMRESIPMIPNHLRAPDTREGDYVRAGRDTRPPCG